MYFMRKETLMNLNHLIVDYKVTEKSFNFPKKYGLPFYFVSAADGTNVVKVIIIIFLYLHEYYDVCRKTVL